MLSDEQRISNQADLLAPEKFNKPIDISSLDKHMAKAMLQDMLLIRKSEQKIAEMKKKAVIKGPVHLGVGQEAIAVGISKRLTSSDDVFGNHRSHSHLLALGSDLRRFFAEILGKSSGLSKGMGGSMHLLDESVGFYGSVPIVSGTVPLAVGASLSAKLNDSNNIAVSYFGDGAVEEGVVHESMNLAKVLNLPILYYQLC